MTLDIDAQIDGRNGHHPIDFGPYVGDSNDPEPDLVFGCVWSDQRGVDNVDRRWLRERYGQRRAGGVFWDAVLFEDRSCLTKALR